MEEKYEELKKAVEEELSCSAHNMEHVMRVYNLSLYLADGEPKVNLDILKPAALLHDIARVKEDRDDSGCIDHAVLGAKMAEKRIEFMERFFRRLRMEMEGRCSR